MRTTLSDDRVKRLAGKAGVKRDVWDAKVPGLHVRVTKAKSGTVSKHWRFLYTVGGKRRVWSLGAFPDLDVDQAQARAGEARQAVKDGRDPRAEHEAEIAARESARLQSQRRTLVSLAAAHVRHLRRKGLEPTSIREEIRQLRREVFSVVEKSTPAADVQPEQIDAVIARIVKRGSKTVADRVRSTLFSLYKWGRADRTWRHVLTSNPVEAVERPLKKSERRPRERVLTDDEVKALWLAAEPAADGKADLPAGVLHPVIGAAFRLRLLTGQRWTEITKARWKHVTRERVEVNGKVTEVPVWTIPAENTKTRERTHVVPLSPQALAVLDSVRPITQEFGWMFPALRGTGHLGTVNRSFRAWKKRAKVEDFIGKDVRRTVITGLSRLGVDLEVRQAVANHASRGVTKRVYDRYDLLAEKRAALEKWGRHVEKVLTGESARVVEFQARA